MRKNADDSNACAILLGREHESVAVKETVSLSFLEQQFCMNFHKAVLSKCPAIITSHLHSCCCIVALGIKAKCGGTIFLPHYFGRLQFHSSLPKWRQT